MISMPSPPPEPIAGGGGPDSYQSQFNTAYYKHWRPELLPFFYGRPGADPVRISVPPAVEEFAAELTQDQKWDLADSLAARGICFDEQIAAQGEDPYATMYGRKFRQGYQRVPCGKGRSTGMPAPVNPDDFVGPVTDGYLLVSVDIADFPPYQP